MHALWNKAIQPCVYFGATYIHCRSLLPPNMGKGPGLFTEIGKKTRDLLTKDYIQDQKVTISTETESGLAFTSTGLKKGGFFLGDIITLFKFKNFTTAVQVDTDSKIFTTITSEEIAPGLKMLLSFSIPDQASSKVEFQYHHEHAGLGVGVGLTSSPVLEVSGAFGSEAISVGGEVAFDSSSGTFTKYNAGIGFTKPDFSAAATLVDKGDLLKASYQHTVSPVTNSIVAAEIAHRFSTNENTFTVGSSYALDPLTVVKSCLNNHGKLAALLQHEWRPKSLLTLSGEIDTKALERRPKVGLALALKP